jgi:hypothetical protein
MVGCSATSFYTALFALAVFFNSFYIVLAGRRENVDPFEAGFRFAAMRDVGGVDADVAASMW